MFKLILPLTDEQKKTSTLSDLEGVLSSTAVTC